MPVGPSGGSATAFVTSVDDLVAPQSTGSVESPVPSIAQLPEAETPGVRGMMRHPALFTDVREIMQIKAPPSSPIPTYVWHVLTSKLVYCNASGRWCNQATDVCLSTEITEEYNLEPPWFCIKHTAHAFDDWCYHAWISVGGTIYTLPDAFDSAWASFLHTAYAMYWLATHTLLPLVCFYSF